MREQRIYANSEKSMLGLRHIFSRDRIKNGTPRTPQLLICKDNIEGGIL